MKISSDHVVAWIDRIGNMVFIADEADGETMAPSFYLAAISDHDRSHGLAEAAVWWM